jgi:hypothetical protein
MSFSIPYKLSKDSYPEMTICPEGTVVDNGIHGIIYTMPRAIDIQLPDGSMISVNNLVDCYCAEYGIIGE